CEQLPSVDNGDRVGHEPQNGPYRSVTFQCSRSYKLEGKNTVRCQNGFWEKLPSCLPPCQFDQIPEKHNLQKPSSTIFVEEGKSQELRCKPGYYYRSYVRYHDIATATCKNGRMQFPTCKYNFIH
ncbi:complement factor H-like isoform X1, partial [Arapaima gigas]